MLILILILAYFATRFVANHSPGAFPVRGAHQIKVLEQLPVGKEQKVLVIEACGRYFLLGVCASGMSVLAEFTAEEAEQHWIKVDTDQMPSFYEALLKQLKEKMKQQGGGDRRE